MPDQTEAILDTVVALMTPEDLAEIAAAAKADADAAAALLAAMENYRRVKERVVRRALDRIPRSVIESFSGGAL